MSIVKVISTTISTIAIGSSRGGVGHSNPICTGISNTLYIINTPTRASHINLFGPRENARYHEDSPDGWTVLLYSNRYWDINEAGETKFILPVDLMNNEAIQSDTTDYPVILSIAPIPGRLVLFKGDLYHTATGFRSAWRFTPTIQFFNTGDQK